MGKTVKEAKGEVAYGNEFFRWYAEEAVRIHGRWMQAPAGGSRLLTIKKPVGPCLFVTPWNFPIAMGTRKIGPAVAAGCTMVVKPAQQTPLTMLALAAILAEAGLPDGVLNVVPTTRAAELSKTLQADDRLRKVSFTGSTGIGRVMVRQSADQLQRVSMELGGNAPFVVFDDADLDAAVEGAMVAKMRNMGEACTAANRFLVHSSVADEFAQRLADRMAALAVGRGQDEGVDVGPLIDEKAVESVSPAGHRRGPRRRQGAHRRHRRRRRRASSTRRRCWSAYRPTRRSTARRSSGRSRRSRPSRPRTRRSSGPTTPSTAWRPTSSPATWPAPSGSPSALDYGMVGVNTGLVSNAAAPFGGREGQRLRPRGRLRGHRGVPRDDVRRTCRRLTEAPWSRYGDGRRTQYAEFAGHAEGDSRLLRGVEPRRRRRPRGRWPGSTPCPGLKRQPNLVFAAARWHGVPAPGPYAGAARRRCSATTAPIRATILARATQTNEVGRLATLRARPSRCWPTAGRSRWSRRARAPG